MIRIQYCDIKLRESPKSKNQNTGLVLTQTTAKGMGGKGTVY